MNSLPLFISTLFEPMLVLCFVMLAAGWQYGLRETSLMWYSVYIVLFSLSIAGTRLFLARRAKTNWDISDRKKRVIPLLVLTALFAGNLWFISRFGNRELLSLHTVWFFWIIGFFLITLQYKISGHISVLTLAAMRWWPLIFFVPLVGWSRVTLKRHTLKEVMGGALYSLILYEAWIRFF